MNRRNPGKGSFNVEIYDATDIIRGHAVEIIPGYKQFYLYDQSLFRNVAKAMSYYALEKFAADNGMTLIMPDYTSPVKRNPKKEGAMKRKEPKTEIRTREQARAAAQRWQQWTSGQNLSYGEYAYYADYFTKLGKKFGLMREFKENGII